MSPLEPGAPIPGVTTRVTFVQRECFCASNPTCVLVGGLASVALTITATATIFTPQCEDGLATEYSLVGLMSSFGAIGSWLFTANSIVEWMNDMEILKATISGLTAERDHYRDRV